jgi:hypothetical protein
MNKQMKILCAIHEYMLQHGKMTEPFVWTESDASYDLRKRCLITRTFQVSNDFQQLVFARGNMNDLIDFCVSRNIDTYDTTKKIKNKE